MPRTGTETSSLIWHGRCAAVIDYTGQYAAAVRHVQGSADAHHRQLLLFAAPFYRLTLCSCPDPGAELSCRRSAAVGQQPGSSNSPHVQDQLLCTINLLSSCTCAGADPRRRVLSTSLLEPSLVLMCEALCSYTETDVEPRSRRAQQQLSGGSPNPPLSSADVSELCSWEAHILTAAEILSSTQRRPASASHAACAIVCQQVMYCAAVQKQAQSPNAGKQLQATE